MTILSESIHGFVRGSPYACFYTAKAKPDRSHEEALCRPRPFFVESELLVKLLIYAPNP